MRSAVIGSFIAFALLIVLLWWKVVNAPLRVTDTDIAINAISKALENNSGLISLNQCIISSRPSTIAMFVSWSYVTNDPNFFVRG